MILQLNPYVPLWHVKSAQPCEAFFVIDYGKDDDLIPYCLMRDGEIWGCRTPDLRGVKNQTLGRRASEVPDAKD